MPLETAEAMLDAAREYALAHTRVEQDEAARRYVEAEEEHFRRQHVERRPQSLFSLILPGALLVILAVVLALSIAISVTTHDTATKASNTADTVRELSEGNRLAEFKNCERGNETRPESLKKYIAEEGTLLTAITLEKEHPQTAGRVAYIHSLHHALRVDRRATNTLIEAQAEYAVKDGSVVIDCSKATAG